MCASLLYSVLVSREGVLFLFVYIFVFGLILFRSMNALYINLLSKGVQIYECITHTHINNLCLIFHVFTLRK